jgi:hypothetical protein
MLSPGSNRVKGGDAAVNASVLPTSSRVASSPEETSVRCEAHGQVCIAAMSMKLAEKWTGASPLGQF